MALLFVIGCSGTQDLQKEVQTFLDRYNAEFQRLSYESSKAEWASNTMIVEGDTTNSYRTRMANEALAAYTGSKENIEKATRYLTDKEKLLPLQVKQLEKVLYNAADNPQTVEALVKERIKLEAEQTEKLYGFDFKMGGKSVSTNEIDDILKLETNLDKRLEAWEASKEVGKTLKEGLVELQRLRNETVRALGYPDYFAYQVSDYGMTTEELRARCSSSTASSGRSTGSSTRTPATSSPRSTGSRTFPTCSPRTGFPTGGVRTGRRWSPSRGSISTARSGRKRRSGSPSRESSST